MLSLFYQFPTSKARSSIESDTESNEEETLNQLEFYHITTLPYSTTTSRSNNCTRINVGGRGNAFPRRESSGLLDLNLDDEEEEEDEEEDDLYEETIISDSENGSNKGFYTNTVPQYQPIFKSNGYRYNPTPKKSSPVVTTTTSSPSKAGGTTHATSWTLEEIKNLTDSVQYCTNHNIMTWKNVIIVMKRNAGNNWIEKTSDQSCNKWWKLKSKADNEAKATIETDRSDLNLPSNSERVVRRRAATSTNPSSTISTLTSSSISLPIPSSIQLPLSTKSIQPTEDSTATNLLTKPRTIAKPWSTQEIKKLTSIVKHFDKNKIYRTWEIISKEMGIGGITRNSGMCCTKWNSLQKEKFKLKEEGTYIESDSDSEYDELVLKDHDTSTTSTSPTTRQLRSIPTTTTSTSTSKPNKTNQQISRINRRWTEEEVKNLTKLVNESDQLGLGRNWKEISKKLNSNRTSTQATDKWRGIQNKLIGKGRGCSNNEVRRGSKQVGNSGTSSRSSTRRRTVVVKKEVSSDGSFEEEEEEEDELVSDNELQSEPITTSTSSSNNNPLPLTPPPFYYNPIYSTPPLPLPQSIEINQLGINSTTSATGNTGRYLVESRKRKVSDSFDEEEYIRSLKRSH